jgi:hypothetical protein
MLYGLGDIQSGLTALIGKVVSIYTDTMSISRCKFTTVADPLIITVVKQDGTPYTPTITRSIPFSSIASYGELGGALTVVRAPVYRPYSGPTQAGMGSNWLLYGALAVGGFLVLKKMGIFGKTKKSHRR